MVSWFNYVNIPILLVSSILSDSAAVVVLKKKRTQIVWLWFLPLMGDKFKKITWKTTTTHLETLQGWWSRKNYVKSKERRRRSIWKLFKGDKFEKITWNEKKDKLLWKLSKGDEFKNYVKWKEKRATAHLEAFQGWWIWHLEAFQGVTDGWWTSRNYVKSKERRRHIPKYHWWMMNLEKLREIKRRQGQVGYALGW